MDDDPFELLSTTQSGTYKVLEVISVSPLSVTYRATGQTRGTDVSLQVFRLPTKVTTPQRNDFVERLRRRAETLLRLAPSNPAIIRPIEVGVLPEAAGNPFIANEWLSGRRLSAVVQHRADGQQAPLTAEQALNLLTPIARALARAHTPPSGAPLLHKNLGAGSIVLSKTAGHDAARLLGLGYSDISQRAHELMGLASATHGTFSPVEPQNAAPEQWAEDRYGKTGPWTDVWGLALTYVACVVGAAPLAGDQTSIIRAATAEDERPTPRAFGIRVPHALEVVLHRALAVRPQQRYRSVNTFWTELEQAVLHDRAPSVAVHQSSTPQLELSTGDQRPAIKERSQPTHAAPTEPSITRRPVAKLAVALAAVGLLLVVLDRVYMAIAESSLELGHISFSLLSGVALLAALLVAGLPLFFPQRFRLR